MNLVFDAKAGVEPVMERMVGYSIQCTFMDENQ